MNKNLKKLSQNSLANKLLRHCLTAMYNLFSCTINFSFIKPEQAAYLSPLNFLLCTEPRISKFWCLTGTVVRHMLHSLMLDSQV